MKPAAIWTTLRLPTLVKANSPAFSLHKRKRKEISYPYIHLEKIINSEHESSQRCLHRDRGTSTSAKQPRYQNGDALIHKTSHNQPQNQYLLHNIASLGLVKLPASQHHG